MTGFDSPDLPERDRWYLPPPEGFSRGACPQHGLYEVRDDHFTGRNEDDCPVCNLFASFNKHKRP